MPGTKRPTPEDAKTARRVLLDGLARDADIFEVLSGLAPLDPRNDTFPGEVFLHLAADALEWCRATPAEPLPLEGLRERFLPECAFRGRQNGSLTRTGARRSASYASGRTQIIQFCATRLPVAQNLAVTSNGGFAHGPAACLRSRLTGASRGA
jgi:hypothetical protein